MILHTLLWLILLVRLLKAHECTESETFMDLYLDNNKTYLEELLPNSTYFKLANFSSLANFNASCVTKLNIEEVATLKNIENIKYLPNLENMTLYSNPDLNDLPNGIFKHNEKLTHIIIRDHRLKLHENTFQGLKNLLTLNMDNNWLDFEETHTIGLLEDAKKLKEFHWVHDRCWSDNQTMRWPDQMVTEDHAFLEYFEYTRAGHCPFELNLIAFPKELTSLTHLKLVQTNLTGEQIGQFLSKFPSLDHLTLRSNGLQTLEAGIPKTVQTLVFDENNSLTCDWKTVTYFQSLKSLTKYSKSNTFFNCTGNEKTNILEAFKLLQKSNHHEAELELKLALIVGLAIGCIILIIVAYFVFKNHLQIQQKLIKLKNWAQYHQLCLAEEDDHEVDVFLMHHQQDLKIVENMYIKLSSETYSYVVRTEEHFGVGKNILDECPRFMDMSKKIVFLISGKFLNCGICLNKMSQALDDTNRAQKIIIVSLMSHGDLKNHLNPDIKLPYRVNNILKVQKIYDYDNGSEKFWDKFRYVLPHGRKQKRKNNDLEMQ